MKQEEPMDVKEIRDIQSIELDLIAHGCNIELVDEYAEAIKRACAEVIRCKVEGGPKCPDGGDLFHIYMDGVGDAVEAACAAILQADPWQEKKA